MWKKKEERQKIKGELKFKDKNKERRVGEDKFWNIAEGGGGKSSSEEGGDVL
jgi:hypothetical protein